MPPKNSKGRAKKSRGKSARKKVVKRKPIRKQKRKVVKPKRKPQPSRFPTSPAITAKLNRVGLFKRYVRLSRWRYVFKLSRSARKTFGQIDDIVSLIKSSGKRFAVHVTSTYRDRAGSVAQHGTKTYADTVQGVIEKLQKETRDEIAKRYTFGLPHFHDKTAKSTALILVVDFNDKTD